MLGIWFMCHLDEDGGNKKVTFLWYYQLHDDLKPGLAVMKVKHGETTFCCWTKTCLRSQTQSWNNRKEDALSFYDHKNSSTSPHFYHPLHYALSTAHTT